VSSDIEVKITGRNDVASHLIDPDELLGRLMEAEVEFVYLITEFPSNVVVADRFTVPLTRYVLFPLNVKFVADASSE
jgi:hypothetical protein